MEDSTPIRKTCYAAAKNKGPILDVLRTLKRSPRRILEVSSGTGEHSEYFLSSLPEIECYQPSEMDMTMMESIIDWTSSFRNKCRLPIKLDVLSSLDMESLECSFYDCLININLIHISAPETTGALFDVANRVLSDGGVVVTYGPYRVSGVMVESNEAFDLSLKNRNCEWGIRDLEWVQQEAKKRGFELVQSVPMPANNLTNIWTRGQAPPDPPAPLPTDQLKRLN